MRVCKCVHVWAEQIVLPKMHCTCVWAGGIAEQHDDQRALVYSYPECKSILLNTQWKQTFRNFFEQQVQNRLALMNHNHRLHFVHTWALAHQEN